MRALILKCLAKVSKLLKLFYKATKPTVTLEELQKPAAHVVESVNRTTNSRVTLQIGQEETNSRQNHTTPYLSFSPRHVGDIAKM